MTQSKLYLAIIPTILLLVLASSHINHKPAQFSGTEPIATITASKLIVTKADPDGQLNGEVGKDSQSSPQASVAPNTAQSASAPQTTEKPIANAQEQEEAVPESTPTPQVEKVPETVMLTPVDPPVVAPSENIPPTNIRCGACGPFPGTKNIACPMYCLE